MYGSSYPGAPPTTAKPPSAGTAETLLLIALILQVVFLFAYVAWIAVALAFAGGGLIFLFGPALVIFAGVALLVGLFFLYAGYEWCYKRVRAGDYQDRTWTLILGIIGLLTTLIVGILYIIAYIKIGDAANEQAQMRGMPPGGGYYGPSFGSPPMAPAYPGAPAPVAATPPATAGVPPPSPGTPVAPTCPRCHAPATWIPQYNRYYCYNCQQYV